MTLRINSATTIKGQTTVGYGPPLTISGLQLWLDASDASTITIATGVSQWRDKSGNNNNATQSIGSAQPTVQTAAQNGLNTIRFTASSSQRFLLTSTITPLSACTLICVVKRGGPSGANLVEVLGTTTGNYPFVFEWYSDTRFYAVISGRNTNTPGGYNSTAYNCVSCGVTSSASGSFFKLNGSSLTTSQTGFSSTNNFDALGYSDGSYANCEMAEICFYDTLLGASDVAKIETYLKAKWGTP